jgi:hypothetical protein
MRRQRHGAARRREASKNWFTYLRRPLPAVWLARAALSGYVGKTLRGRSSEVERQLPKLNVGGSIPPARSSLGHQAPVLALGHKAPAPKLLVFSPAIIC